MLKFSVHSYLHTLNEAVCAGNISRLSKIASKGVLYMNSLLSFSFLSRCIILQPQIISRNFHSYFNELEKEGLWFCFPPFIRQAIFFWMKNCLWRLIQLTDFTLMWSMHFLMVLLFHHRGCRHRESKNLIVFHFQSVSAIGSYTSGKSLKSHFKILVKSHKLF